MAGKGSKPRPFSNRKKFEENWDKIFKKDKDNGKETSRQTDESSNAEKET